MLLRFPDLSGLLPRQLFSGGLAFAKNLSSQLETIARAYACRQAREINQAASACVLDPTYEVVEILDVLEDVGDS